jgi:hypothetical protein
MAKVCRDNGRDIRGASMNARLTKAEKRKLWEITEKENRIFKLLNLAKGIEDMVKQGYAKFSNPHISQIYKQIKCLNQIQSDYENESDELEIERLCFLSREAAAISKIEDQFELIAEAEYYSHRSDTERPAERIA